VNHHRQAVELDDRYRASGVLDQDARARRLRKHARLVSALDPLFARALEQQAARCSRNQRPELGKTRTP
jgi:hypothetical protein